MKLDYLNGTPYAIQQHPDMYHFNSDTELLGRFLKARHKDTVLDIGTNNGALLYYAAMHQPKLLCGIDLFAEVIEVAKDNFRRNGIEAELHVTPVEQFNHEPFDVILCNPPYFKTDNDTLKNENPFIKAARHEASLTIETLFQNVKRLLKDNGTFYLVHRPQQLTNILMTANQYGLSPTRMRLVYGSDHTNAKTVLLAFQFRTNCELTIEKPAFMNDHATF